MNRLFSFLLSKSFTLIHLSCSHQPASCKRQIGSEAVDTLQRHSNHLFESEVRDLNRATMASECGEVKRG